MGLAAPGQERPARTTGSSGKLGLRRERQFGQPAVHREQTFGVLVLEGVGALTNLTAPDGTKGNASVLVDWAEFVGADMVMVQGGESSAYTEKPSKEFPWFTRREDTLRALGRESDPVKGDEGIREARWGDGATTPFPTSRSVIPISPLLLFVFP